MRSSGTSGFTPRPLVAGWRMLEILAVSGHTKETVRTERDVGRVWQGWGGERESARDGRCLMQNVARCSLGDNGFAWKRKRAMAGQVGPTHCHDVSVGVVCVWTQKLVNKGEREKRTFVPFFKKKKVV